MPVHPFSPRELPPLAVGPEVGEQQVWARLGMVLRTKAGLISEPVTISPILYPSYDLVQMLTYSDIREVTVDISAGGGAQVTAYTVPGNERWWLLGWAFGNTSAATRLFVKIGSALFDMEAASSTERQVFAPQKVMLDRGAIIGARGTGNAGDDERDVKVILERTQIWPSADGPGADPV